MADDEKLQLAKHYTDHYHNHRQCSTQAFSQTYKVKLFQLKLYRTRATSGTSDVSTAIIMVAKNGCVTTFSNQNILITKGYLHL